MTTTLQPDHDVVKKRGGYRRLLAMTALVIVCSVAGWMIWGAVRDWADARALRAYFAELEQREPGWQDRVYGKPPTPEQEAELQKWKELVPFTASLDTVISIYDQGLFGGMSQPPHDPAAQLPAEQVAFIEAVRQAWQPLLQKLSTMEKLPLDHRYVDQTASSEMMWSQFNGRYSSAAYKAGDVVELEMLYHIVMNDPQQAWRWYQRSQVLPHRSIHTRPPFLVERWLNMTQPSAPVLLKMQKTLEQLVREDENALLNFGNMLRLETRSIRDMNEGSLSAVKLDFLSYPLGVDEKSPWRSSWLNWARPTYVKFRLNQVFHRPDYLVLRLHQLADRIEGLSQLEIPHRWPTWKQFAESQGIVMGPSLGQTTRTFSDPLPEGLFLLDVGAKSLHRRVETLFSLQALHRTILAAVAAERFRVEKGHFPKDWNDLAPQYLDQPLLDPFTGKPLLIKLREDRMVIYSTGKEGKDEGGENLRYDHYWMSSNPGFGSGQSNMGTRVYIPKLRRGSPFPLEEKELESLKRSTEELQKLIVEGKNQ